MFRKSLNRALLRIQLKTASPLLIAAGDAGLSPSAADITCVRTNHGEHGRTVYIPGSSLKGVLRQSAEASLRSSNNAWACDPLNHHESCWSRRPQGRDARESTPAAYKRMCYACRTFGSLSVKGRASVRDLYPWSPEDPEGTADNRRRANQVEVRNNVAIDRVTGGAHGGALFNKESVPSGVAFWGEIVLENYQLYQFGLLLQALEDINTGFACLGSSSSRGYGEVRAELLQLTVEQPISTTQALKGAAAFLSQQEQDDYGLVREQAPSLTLQPERRGLFDRFSVSQGEALIELRKHALNCLGALA